MLTIRGLGIILGDLAAMGFDAEWGIISAADTDAPHLRERIWILAYANGESWIEGGADNAEEGAGGWHVDRSDIRTPLADAVREREQRILAGGADAQERCKQGERPNRPCGYGFGRWPVEPGMGRVADGVANRVDRIKALGNGQVPRVAATAWEVLK